jgi:hypothetical protein
VERCRIYRIYDNEFQAFSGMVSLGLSGGRVQGGGVV